MADLLDNAIDNPTLTQSHSYELTLLGDVDVGRFFSGPIPEAKLAIVQRAVAVDAKQLAGTSNYEQPRIAVVPVIGVLTKHGSEYGISTMGLAEHVTRLANSGQVDAIALWIDSPGGEAAYIYDCVDSIRAAQEKVPVHAYISDLGASGGYAIACACSRISINEGGSAGCIGTYIAVRDFSGYMNKLGVKTYVIAADGGTFKGMGTFGTELTADQQDYIKQRANGLNQLFLKTVGSGRRMNPDQALKLADGRVHIGAEAQKLGLVDAVCSFESSLQTLAMSAKPRAVKSQLRSSQKEALKMEPATFEELEQNLPKAFGQNASADDAKWGMSLMKTKPTLDQARQAWNQRLEEKLDAATAQVAEADKLKLKQEADAAAAQNKPKMPGVSLPKQAENNGVTVASGEDLVQQYNDAIANHMKTGMMRLDAVCAVNKQRPDLHQAYLLSTNANRKDGNSKRVQQLVNDKFVQEAA